MSFTSLTYSTENDIFRGKWHRDGHYLPSSPDIFNVTMPILNQTGKSIAANGLALTFSNGTNEATLVHEEKEKNQELTETIPIARHPR